MNHSISALTSLSTCNDGTGCEEAYQFKQRVEALPSLLLGLCLNRRNSSIVSIATRPFVCGDVLSSRTKMPHDARDVDKIDDVDRMYSHCKNEHIVN